MLDADMRQHFEANVIGNVNLFSLLVPLIRNGNLKKVVAISTGMSDLDLIAKLRIVHLAPYAISKAALNMVVTKFHAQYADEGILFMGVCPGAVDTGHFDNSRSLIIWNPSSLWLALILFFSRPKSQQNNRLKSASCFERLASMPLISRARLLQRMQPRMSCK